MDESPAQELWTRDGSISQAPREEALEGFSATRDRERVLASCTSQYHKMPTRSARAQQRRLAACDLQPAARQKLPDRPSNPAPGVHAVCIRLHHPARKVHVYITGHSTLQHRITAASSMRICTRVCIYPLQAGPKAWPTVLHLSICTSSPSADALSIYPQHQSAMRKLSSCGYTTREKSTCP